MAYIDTHSKCGCSSGVERDLAKVDVEGSNPFARSKKTFLRKGYFFTSGEFLHSEHHNWHPYGIDAAVLFISDVEKERHDFIIVRATR